MAVGCSMASLAFTRMAAPPLLPPRLPFFAGSAVSFQPPFAASVFRCPVLLAAALVSWTRTASAAERRLYSAEDLKLLGFKVSIAHTHCCAHQSALMLSLGGGLECGPTNLRLQVFLRALLFPGAAGGVAAFLIGRQLSMRISVGLASVSLGGWLAAASLLGAASRK